MTLSIDLTYRPVVLEYNFKVHGLSIHKLAYGLEN